MQRSPAAPLAALPANRPNGRTAFTSLFAIWRQRRALSRLDERARQDIGLTKNEAHIEATRPFWDVPMHWKN